MSEQTDRPDVIGPEQAALIERPVSIIVGSRDARHRPHLMRAAGARLSPDRRRLRVLLPQAGSEALLDDLRANGLVAVVFSEPSTHRTVQLKGFDAAPVPAEPADAVLAEQYVTGFAGEIGQLGFSAELASTITGGGRALVAVEFGIAEAYEQTPGPAAGERIAARAG